MAMPYCAACAAILRAVVSPIFTPRPHWSSLALSPISCSQRGASAVALKPASANDCALPAGPNLICVFIVTSTFGAADEGAFKQVISRADPEIAAVDRFNIAGQGAQTIAAQRI